MAKKTNFDLMFKAIMKSYDIPSKKDILALSAKLDRIEKMLQRFNPESGAAPVGRKKTIGTKKSKVVTASDMVFQVIENSRNGADFARIQLKTGFEEKKLRNIIFRLNKLGKIKRQARGIYIVV